MFRGNFFNYYENIKPGNEIHDAIASFHDLCFESYNYFALLSMFANESMVDINNELKDNNDFSKSVNFICQFLQNSSKEELDPGLDIFDKNYDAVLNTAYSLVEDIKKALKDETSILAFEYYCKQDQFETRQIYNYSTALEILYSDSLDITIKKFIKHILLSADYNNAFAIYKIRNFILSSDEIDKNIKKLFSNRKPQNNLLAIFYADHKLLSFVMSSFNRNIYPIPDIEYKPIYFVLIVYLRFILDIYIFLFEYHHVHLPVAPEDDKFSKILSRDLKIDILLSKFYNRIDLLLFHTACSEMTNFERWYFFVKRLLDDVCLHEQATIGSNILESFQKFNAGIGSSMRATEESIERFKKCNSILKEMINEALNRWNNGCKLSHTQMIDSFNEIEKYQECLKISEIVEELREKLINICKENNFPYIEGLNMFTGRRPNKPTSKSSKKTNKNKSGKKETRAKKKA